MTKLTPRIARIHALEESVIPSRLAFANEWPEAKAYDLLDTSLSADLAAAGKLDDAMTDRFVTLAQYAVASAASSAPLQGVLFTCSAFGPAIEAVKRSLSIPVLKPNEAALREAVSIGQRIGLVVSFLPSLGSLRAELHEEAAAAGKHVDIFGVCADGALEALQAGEPDLHDQRVAEAAAGLGAVDVVVLGQFSLARATPVVRTRTTVPVLTTPESAVRALRRSVG